MYLDSAGNMTDRSVTGALAAGVPGSVAGLYEAHRKYGTRPWSELVLPAMELAERGFAIDTSFTDDDEDGAERLAKDSASAALFLRDGKFVAIGTSWRAPELAAVLRRIAEQGRDGFYKGETADLIVAAMKRSGGIISHEDLAGYKAIWRTPLEFSYHGTRVVSMPPVSSGGLTLALILGILERSDIGSLGWRSPQSIHLLAEAERRAFARRNTLLGDPAFVKIPVASFMSTRHGGGATRGDRPHVIGRRRRCSTEGTDGIPHTFRSSTHTGTPWRSRRRSTRATAPRSRCRARSSCSTTRWTTSRGRSEP